MKLNVGCILLLGNLQRTTRMKHDTAIADDKWVAYIQQLDNILYYEVKDWGYFEISHRILVN